MKKLFIALLLIAAGFPSQGQDRSILLYPEGIPNSKKTPKEYIESTDSSGYIRKVSEPALLAFYPPKEKANGTAVIICPGGGYELVVASDEGAAVAQEFIKLGITAFVLKYRLPNEAIMIDKSIGPLQDAQKALMTLRKRAAEFGIHPNKIGIVGLSAGGHLASTAGTHFEKSFIDNPDHISLRPDFMILVYPVITFGSFGPPRSRANLLGKTPTAELLYSFSNENHVSATTPPTFLVHASDDTVVPVENSLMMYQALRKEKVKVEMHIFQDGGHGFGIENPERPDRWMDWCKGWLIENGF
jgi:acetyl esterase/lipase